MFSIFTEENFYDWVPIFYSSFVRSSTMETRSPGVVVVTECSDVHIRMIHLRQANKRDNDLAAFRQLQTEKLFTDMTLILKVSTTAFDIYCHWF
jgi:hypothetical protein